MNISEAILKFKEKHKNEREIDHVLDFLKSEYGNKKSINFSYEQALEKANIWTHKLNEKNKNLKSSGEVEPILNFDNGYKIVRLIDQTSKDWEGLYMRHCVASYKNYSNIYSLRDNKNFPHCTLEIKNNTINQIKGKANGLVSPKYVSFVLDFLKSLNLEVHSHDLENLGYTNNIDLEFIKEHFSNYKTFKIKDQEFLYVGNKLKIIKNFDRKDECLLVHFCIYNQCPKAIQMLIDNGTDFFLNCNEPLLLAVKHNNLTAVKILVENGVNVQAENNRALSWATQSGNLEMVKFLIKHGGNLFDDKFDPFGWAIKRDRLDIIKFAISDLSLDKIKLNKALSTASCYGNLEMVKILVKKGAEIEFNNDQALSLSLYNKHFEIYNFLKDHRNKNSLKNNI